MTQLNRRNFIGLGSKTFAGALLGPSLAGSLGSCSKKNELSDFDWRILSNQLNGNILLPNPNDPEFDAFTRTYPKQYGQTFPQAVVRCLSEKDVVTTVKWASRNGIAITTRSGGHSYAGYSTTNQLLLDLSGLNNILLNSSTRLAVLEGGVRNKQVYSAFREPSIGMTHSNCGGVGVSGLTLGGGFGFNMREHGLTCDQLVETRMVTAEGDVVICNEKENPDLFWAIRGGGGGNFGVHTSFTFKPFEVTNVTRFELRWSDKTDQIFAKLQDVLLAAPNSLGAKVTIELVRVRTRPDVFALRPVIGLVGQFRGEISDFNALIAPVNAISTAIGTITNEPYWKAQEMLVEEGDSKYIHERSRFAFEPLSEAAQANIFENLAKWPGKSGTPTFKYYLLGGAISEKAPEETAFFARNAKMITTIELTWTDKDQEIFTNKQWLDDFHTSMIQYTSKYSYINFIDRNESNYLETYYGPALARLKAIKKQVDPKNYFRFPQGIPVG